jgi:Holliday junction resolvase
MLSQKHMKDSERTYVKLVNERGGLAHRVAGSGCGKYAICDVITVENKEVFAVEIKSTKEVKLRLSKKEVERLHDMQRVVANNKPFKAKLAIHFKRRGWKEIDITKQKISSKYELN